MSVQKTSNVIDFPDLLEISRRTLADCRAAELKIQQLRGRSPASLSSHDKNALIASLATLVAAAANGMRPSPGIISLVTELLSPSYGLKIEGKQAGW